MTSEPKRHRSSRGACEPTLAANEIEQLIEDVHRLRLTLTADLSAAAAAVEAGELAVARDIVGSDSLELRRLTSPRKAAPTGTSNRRRRALLVLPAIPLVGALAVTGAAAMTHHAPAQVRVSGHQATAPTTDLTPSDVHRTAATTLHQLERAVRHNPRGAHVARVAAHLHDQLTAIIATSPNSARSIGQVRHLLSIEQQLLKGHHLGGAAIALAESRQLTQILHITPLPTPRSTAPVLRPTSSKPTSKPTPKPTHSKPPTTPSTSTTSTPSAPPNPLPTPRSTHRHHKHRHHSGNPLPGSGLIGSLKNGH